jgi:hypothetical protein
MTFFWNFKSMKEEKNFIIIIFFEESSWDMLECGISSTWFADCKSPCQIGGGCNGKIRCATNHS